MVRCRVSLNINLNKLPETKIRSFKASTAGGTAHRYNAGRKADKNAISVTLVSFRAGISRFAACFEVVSSRCVLRPNIQKSADAGKCRCSLQPNANGRRVHQMTSGKAAANLLRRKSWYCAVIDFSASESAGIASRPKRPLSSRRAFTA